MTILNHTDKQNFQTEKYPMNCDNIATLAETCLQMIYFIICFLVFIIWLLPIAVHSLQMWYMIPNGI